METWLWIAAAVGAAIVIFKFILKPLFKVLAFIVLAGVIWWYFGDQITAWLSSMN